MYPLRDRILRWSLAACLAAFPLSAAAEDAAAIARALAAVGARDWVDAADHAESSGPMASALVDWHRLRAGQGRWPEYLEFARKHRDWPGMALLYRRGDALLRTDLPAAEIIDWFGERRPDTLIGAKALITALASTDPAAAKAEMARFWTNQALSEDDSANFVAIYGADLIDIHDARLAKLLDLGEWQSAKAVLPLASDDAQGVGRARIALQSRQEGVDALILALPEALRNDAGLAMDRFLWRIAAKLPEPARDLMLERSTSAEALRDPAIWADKRADFARAAMREGDWPLAEKLAAGNFLHEGGEDFIDLEWLAGYAALKQGASDRALIHFQRLEAGVSSPISLSRALYWQGRAHEVAGETEAAGKAFRHSATWQTAYYGQLSAEKLRQPMQPDLAVAGRAEETLPEWRGSALRYNQVWQAGAWLLAAGDADLAARFFLHLAETAEPEDIGRMARLMLEVGRPWNALRLAKAAAAKGVIYPAAYFPLTGLETKPLGLPSELVMSIARRESEFNHGVSSHAGALGLMQVMPGTARDMARKIGEPYDQPRLTQDATYNARLGAAYLQGLRDRFGPSIALVSAGYNAGPGRSARWLQDFGDLRKTADPVDWVELIPFDETRNYVMRVTEALPVYRARIMGHPAPIVPTYDLTGGGMMPLPPQPPIRLAFSSRPPMSARALVHYAAGGVLAEVVGAPPPIEEANAGTDIQRGATTGPGQPSLAGETATR
ncbi:lytic transglycosylase domain-containing protein [Paracoccus sp. MBLB3053]|uniref:Lytic transglycosylase domain-containing protein n=1 Tax=Paracoccus aurantius TaxID=3073814 RepID=A0ABU2HN58_9RHOB|nr:lytic transglycosylase domain-containing protein [Paracoccus sp. MBLB3053]MDS9466469.1 lytic transglycosylase domain-containing protein [Paracoccus sp. MBLB3053]